jgi:hypothetical protein
LTRAAWTYEVPPGASGAVGLEDYAVEDSAGELVGTVLTVLKHDENVLLVVEGGTPPLRRDRRAVAWDAVAKIDHSATLVRLALSAMEFERALELPADKAVEHGGAEATRITDVPQAGSSAPDSPGPVDRPTYTTALILGLLGAFSALVVVILLTATEESWPLFLIVTPAALFAASGFFAYRFFFGRQAERL